jgi:hypothetical protein
MQDILVEGGFEDQRQRHRELAIHCAAPGEVRCFCPVARSAKSAHVGKVAFAAALYDRQDMVGLPEVTSISAATKTNSCERVVSAASTNALISLKYH